MGALNQLFKVESVLKAAVSKKQTASLLSASTSRYPQVSTAAPPTPPTRPCHHHKEKQPPLWSSDWLFTVRCPDRTQQSWPAVWPTTAPRTPATAPTTQSLCRSSRRRTPGTNGAKRWIFSCLSSALRWTWEMFGDFRTYVIKTAAVSGLEILIEVARSNFTS